MAQTYKIIGDLPVAGKNPGEIVSDGELEGANVEALIEGGHIAPTTSKAVKASTEEQ
jgi:hypothetical protein